MDRYTKRDYLTNKAYAINVYIKPLQGAAYGDAIERLALYEDNCLTPEEISDLMIANGDKATELASLRAALKRYKRWVNDLQSGMYVNCVYCGHRYGPEKDTPVSMADVLKAHVEKCPEHPMSKLKTELERATAERDDYQEKHETLMRRHSQQVEAIRKRIDAGGLTSDEKRLLNDLGFETRYDRRDPQAGEVHE